jgi:hypothetical protein
MTEIISIGPSDPQKMPSFKSIEGFIAEMASLREDLATSMEPSSALLERIAQAIEKSAAQKALVDAAARPGGIVDVGSYLAYLLAAYPNAGAQDATIFGQLLVDDVMELAPPIAAVEIACRHWRQGSKFPPAISELLEAVKSVKTQVQNTTEFISSLPTRRDRLRRDLGEN